MISNFLAGAYPSRDQSIEMVSTSVPIATTSDKTETSKCPRGQAFSGVYSIGGDPMLQMAARYHAKVHKETHNGSHIMARIGMQHVIDNLCAQCNPSTY